MNLLFIAEPNKKRRLVFILLLIISLLLSFIFIGMLEKFERNSILPFLTIGFTGVFFSLIGLIVEKNRFQNLKNREFLFLDEYLKIIALIINLQANKEKEINTLKNYLQNKTKQNKDNRYFASFLNYVKSSNLKVSSIIKNLKRLNKSDKVQILYQLMKIAARDKLYTNSEKQIINEVAKELGIADTTVNKIKNMFEFRYSYNEYKKSDASYKTYPNIRFLINSAYETLGLENSATNEEVKSKYRFLVKQYHPDTHKNYDDNDMFIAIQQAYELIQKEREI